MVSTLKCSTNKLSFIVNNSHKDQNNYTHTQHQSKNFRLRRRFFIIPYLLHQRQHAADIRINADGPPLDLLRADCLSPIDTGIGGVRVI